MFELLLIVFLALLIYQLYRFWPLLRTLFTFRQMHQEAKRRYEEERESESRARATEHPDQSSVERINEANLDLDGGEYVEYEEVKGK